MISSSAFEDTSVGLKVSLIVDVALSSDIGIEASRRTVEIRVDLVNILSFCSGVHEALSKLTA